MIATLKTGPSCLVKERHARTISMQFVLSVYVVSLNLLKKSLKLFENVRMHFLDSSAYTSRPPSPGGFQEEDLQVIIEFL